MINFYFSDTLFLFDRRWTDDEDKLLVEVVETLKQGNSIPWPEGKSFPPF